MKKTLLVVISVMLVLASAFGFYASYVGLKDVPRIQQNKNEQAADIEESINLIDDNLDDYNKMVALQKELDEAKAKEKENNNDPAKAGTAAPTATKQPSAARADFGKPQRSLATAQEISQRQAEYNAAQSQVSQAQANLDSAKQELNNSQAKASSLSSSVNSASSAYNTYQSAKKEYENTPSWLYSSKNSAKAAMDNANTNYQASLGGYSSIDEMQGALVAANQEVSANQAKVDQANAKLTASQQALNTAKANLDAANGNTAPSQPVPSNNANYVSGSDLPANPNANTNTNTNTNTNSNPGNTNTNANANTNTNTNKPANSASSILSNITLPKASDTPAVSDEEADRLKKEIADTADKLAKLKERGDVKGIVEDGIKILLENDEIASRVSDKKDYESVVKAARDYLEETSDSVSRELTTRQQLYFALRILSILGAIAGILGIIVAISPKRFLFTMTLVMSIFTILCAIALNIYGYLAGYLNFVYTRNDGAGDGGLQLIAMLSIMISAVLSIIIVSICRKAFKKALKKRKMRQHLMAETEKAERIRAEKSAFNPTSFDQF